MSTSPDKRTGFSTRAIHFGYNPAANQGALVPPIYTSATYAFPDVAYGARCFAGTEPGYFYTRIANPTLALLEARLTSLEQGAGAVVFGSGMGAITATMWSLLEQGDEVLADITLYGCTFAFMNHGLTRFGVTVRHVDMTDPANVAQAMGPKTRVVYFETPANPNMRMVDIAAVSAIAHAGGAKVVVDNTYCTPYLQQPLLLGADVSVHSMTKYLGGHGDLTAGAAIFADVELAQRVRQFGGMVAFELKGGLQAGIRFMDALQLVTRAVSLGDAETLAQHPASMTHATYTPEERQAHGITEGLVRLSIGLEDIGDVLADIAQALDCAG